MYDVIVVGARCAGAPTAMLFARSGYHVLMVDRATFPRDTLSTLYIQQPGVRLLEDWKVLDRVKATGCPPIERMCYRRAGVELEGRLWEFDGISVAYAPRRFLLDHVLAESAVGAGVDFLAGHSVQELLFDGDRVTGVRLRNRGGKVHPARAHLVVGADGMRSTVADAVRAETLVSDVRKSCVYYAYWPWSSRRFEIYESDGRWVGVVPTNDDLTLVGVYFPQAEFSTIRSDFERFYHESIRACAPELYSILRGRKPVGRVRGTGDQRNFFRQAAGPGWALVGDAGHHKDSITARGITDAFYQAKLLVQCVGDTLFDRQRLAEALGRYQTERDAMLGDEYRQTLAIAALSTSDRRLRALKEMAANPDAAGPFFASLCGSPFTDMMRPPRHAVGR
ncbi:MAG: NAD(P)/FAD-dependent oxidoreductase [Micromonosporaceae bacterium]